MADLIDDSHAIVRMIMPVFGLHYVSATAILPISTVLQYYCIVYTDANSTVLCCRRYCTYCNESCSQAE